MAGADFKGERLKNARLFRGLTLTELANQTDISKQSISLYENNSNHPDHERVLRMASTLKVPYDYFFQKDSCRALTEVTYFRSFASATKMERTSQSIKLEFVAKMYKALSEYIAFPQWDVPTIDFSVDDYEVSIENQSEVSTEIELLAKEVRKYWGISNEPIKNLQLLLESKGLIITGFDTHEDKIDAFSQRTTIENGDVFLLAVSLGQRPEGRIRFDIAHELGHILLHPWSENLELISKDEFKQREKQANMFASSFLLPKSSFGKEVRAHPTDLKYYQYLKPKWKMSIQAMIYRSNQLGIITNNQFQYLMRQISKNGWRTKEPGDKPYYIKVIITVFLGDVKPQAVSAFIAVYRKDCLALDPGLSRCRRLIPAGIYGIVAISKTDNFRSAPKDGYIFCTKKHFAPPTLRCLQARPSVCRAPSRRASCPVLSPPR